MEYTNTVIIINTVDDNVLWKSWRRVNETKLKNKNHFWYSFEQKIEMDYSNTSVFTKLVNMFSS